MEDMIYGTLTIIGGVILFYYFCKLMSIEGR